MSTSLPVKNLRSHSCVLCQQRKVKCDRNDPCAGCIKAGVECVASVPAPPGRRKRRADTDVQSKLRRSAGLLRGHEARPQSPDGLESDVDEGHHTNSSKALLVPAESEGGKLIVDQGEARFVDNTLWTGLSDEFRDSRELLHQQKQEPRKSSGPANIAFDASSLLLGSSPSDQRLTSVHPQPVQMFRLWQTFLDNVNPLSKLVHAPTVQAQVLDATSDLQNLPANTEALLFAIYTTALCSLSSEECSNIMGEPKSAVFPKFLAATRQALVNAGFLDSSDLMVLQALVLLLIAMRQNHNPHALWILTGVAIRIGQRIGLHCDGASLGLPIFEAEMRRRVWWQIILLDNRTAQLSGLKDSIVANFFNTNIPSNVNDADLNPNMTEMPFEHKGQTEMIFCLITYEIGKFAKDSGWQKLFAAPSPSSKDKIIDELEALLENKFLRYCDRSIPLHFLCLVVARSIITKMRLSAHHPRYRKADRAAMPNERDRLFNLSLETIEYDTLVHSTKSLKRYLWHVRVYFQMDAFIALLSELRHRPPDEVSNRAWHQIQEVYSSHPELVTENFALYVAIGNLTLRVWETREAWLARVNHGRVDVPSFIIGLRSSRSAKEGVKGGSELPSAQTDQVPQEQQSRGPASSHSLDGDDSTDFNLEVTFDPISVELSPIDWDYWTNLLQEYEQQIGASNAQPMFG